MQCTFSDHCEAFLKKYIDSLNMTLQNQNSTFCFELLVYGFRLLNLCLVLCFLISKFYFSFKISSCYNSTMFHRFKSGLGNIAILLGPFQFLMEFEVKWQEEEFSKLELKLNY